MKVQGTSTEAIKLLDELLRRRVGREKPSFELERSLAEFEESSLQLQLALSSGLLNIAGLIRNEIIKQYHWSEVQSGAVLNLARLLDTYSSPGLDPLPLLATTLATYIKSALIDVYRGADSIFLGGACCSLVFSTEELVAFRDRFRRSPMTDEEYLDLVDKHFVTPIRALRRKHRLAKSSTSRLKPLHPRRDRGDFLMEWPLPPGTRPFEVEQLPRALNLAA